MTYQCTRTFSSILAIFSDNFYMSLILITFFHLCLLKEVQILLVLLISSFHACGQSIIDTPNKAYNLNIHHKRSALHFIRGLWHNHHKRTNHDQHHLLLIFHHLVFTIFLSFFHFSLFQLPFSTIIPIFSFFVIVFSFSTFLSPALSSKIQESLLEIGLFLFLQATDIQNYIVLHIHPFQHFSPHLPHLPFSHYFHFLHSLITIFYQECTFQERGQFDRVFISFSINPLEVSQYWFKNFPQVPTIFIFLFFIVFDSFLSSLS